MPIESTVGEFVKDMERLPSWLPAVYRVYLQTLGGIIKDKMVTQVEPHRYTGALADSIQSKSEDSGFTVRISPTAQRGAYDAGALLEYGSRPIVNCPYAPIKAWSDYRGLPAFPVWYKLRTEGVEAHPFIDDTLSNSEQDIDECERRITAKIVELIVLGNGTVSQ